MVMPKRKITVADVIIIVLALILTASTFVFFSLSRDEHNSAVVRTYDSEFSVDLENDGEIELDSNGYHYILQVIDGEISVKEATCRCGICVDSSPIGKRSGSIVCLPGKLIITCTKEVSVDEKADVVIP